MIPTRGQLWPCGVSALGTIVLTRVVHLAILRASGSGQGFLAWLQQGLEALTLLRLICTNGCTSPAISLRPLSGVPSVPGTSCLGDFRSCCGVNVSPKVHGLET